MTLNLLKRLASLALFAALVPTAARADDPVNGATLFASHCASCHGNSPLTSNGSKIYFGRNARSVIETAIATNNSGMGSLRSAFPTNGTQIADVAAYLGNSPSTLTFASTNVGSTSATQTVTIAASLKGASYAISGLSVAVSGDFARAGGTCGTTVATGTSCTVIVSFTPTATGARSGSLSISHSNTLTPVSIGLSGTGAGAVPTAPVATVSPSALTLATTAIGATSAAQNVTVGNTGNAPLQLSALTLSNTADFTIAGGTCAAGGSVAAGSNCTVSIAFRPSAGATGTRSGSLSIAHNAAGSPGSVSLSGTATAAAAPVAALTAALSFGSVNVGTTSTAQTATLSNSGTAPLAIASVATGSTEFVVSGGTCAAGGTVAAGASCTIGITFTPSGAGARSANLVVTHNAGGGQSSASLSGTGLALTPAISLTPGTLVFSQTLNTLSSAQSVTVGNTGNAALTLSALSIAGAQASEFQIGSAGTCAVGTNIAPNTSCVITVAFTPAALGARTATLSIAHNAAASPSTVTLNGTGTSSPQPAISLNASTLTFNAQTIGTASPAQSVTVINSGAAALTLGAITLTGTAASDFTPAGSCASGTNLGIGASCTLSLTFTPGAIGTRSATLSIASNATNGTAVLSVSGTGAAVPVPSVGLAPASLDFGSQTVATTSTARTATLSNTGSGALAISSITATSGFAVSHNCGTSLAAGASCTLSATFTPVAAGAVTGSVRVVSNATGSPHSLGLTGTGVTASPVLAWQPANTSLAFGNLAVGATPALQTLTLGNQGPGTVTLQQLTLAGAQAADFSLSNGGSCALNATLAQGQSCTVTIAFQPGAVGARAGVLQVTSSGTNPPDVALSGTGIAMSQPALNVTPGAITFNLDASATTGAPQTVNLQNSGTAVLNVTQVRIAAGAFTLAPAAQSGCAAVPFDLLPGQSCALSISWSGSASGTDSGAIEIDSSAAAAPTQVALQVVRTSTATPAAPLSNAGGGGCSIARGDSLFDPVLALLALLAMAVLLYRRAGR